MSIRTAVLFATVALLAVPAAAHDPRTTAKKLSLGLDIEGAGKLSIDYKALHFNAQAFDSAKQSDRFMDFLNGQVWGRMGKAHLDFDVSAEDVDIPKGEYEFGINMTKDEAFSVVFWKGEEKTEIPLEVEKVKGDVQYLGIALLATEYDETFVLEARCGPFRGTVDVNVPYLDPEHDHEDEPGS